MKKNLLPFIILLMALLIISACSSKKDTIKKNQPFDPVTLLKEANDEIDKKNFEDARVKLGKIKSRDATRKYSALAQIRIADTYFKEELYEEAAIEYEHFLNMHPHHKYASYTQYQLAMTYFKRIRTVDVSYLLAQKALQEFEKLLRIYPRNPYLNIIENRIKACKSLLAEYEFYVGNFYFKKGSFRAAANRFNGLIRDYPESKKESESLYYLGLSYKNLGEKDESLKAFTILLEKYPTIELSKKAQNIIESLNDSE